MFPAPRFTKVPEQDVYDEIKGEENNTISTASTPDSVTGRTVINDNNGSRLPQPSVTDDEAKVSRSDVVVEK